jgi:multisubunit Na+/H+ antiporter MnhC subunit
MGRKEFVRIAGSIFLIGLGGTLFGLSDGNWIKLILGFGIAGIGVALMLTDPFK